MREAVSSRKTLLMIRNGTELQTDKQNEKGVNLFTGTGLDKTRHEREVGRTGTCAGRSRHVKLRSQNTQEYHGDLSSHKCEQVKPKETVGS